MEFRFAPEDEAFRREVDTWIRAELPAGYEGSEWERGPEEIEVAKGFTDKLAKKGWLAPAWPKEYGGLGLGYWKQTIYKELMAYYRAPLGNVFFGVDLIGPTLMVYASEEQKQEYLPQILRNEVWWAQGFSEPNAGSDLASLQTRAVLDGDDFVVNGSKIWTSAAQYAEMLMLLVRTDPEAPKHKGISFLLADIKTPGITIQPLADLTGGEPFNQVFFEDVRIPKRNLVGELNRGWYMAATTLDFERSGVDRPARSTRLLEDTIAELRSWGSGPGAPMSDPIVQHKLAQMRVEIDVNRWICYNITSMQAAGKIPNYEASIAKLFGSEMMQRIANTLTEIYDLYGGLRSDSHRARLAGRPAEAYLGTLPESIYQGSSEIQRNVIATRGLGLPRI